MEVQTSLSQSGPSSRATILRFTQSFVPALIRYRLQHALSRLHRARVLLFSKGLGAAIGKMTSRTPSTREIAPRPIEGSAWVAVPRVENPLSLLWIDERLPDPSRDSGSMRMFNLMRLLVAMGHRVHCLPESRTVSPVLAEALRSIGVELPAHSGYVATESPPAWLLRHGSRYDGVIVSRYHLALSWFPLIQHAHPGAIKVLDTVDLHHVREKREADHRDNSGLAAAARATRRMELSTIRQADVTWVVSEAEAVILHAEIPQASVQIVSNLLDLPPGTTSPASRHGLIFVGGAQHPPNVDAIRWLLSDIAPLLQQRLGGCELHLVGTGLKESLAGAHVPAGVYFHGHLPDMDGLLGSCRIGIAPLRFGAGVKGKINQYMAHGLPVVATPVAVEGMHLRNGRDVLVAGNAEDFVQAIERLCQDDELWAQLSANGRENIRRHFSTESALPPLIATFAHSRHHSGI